MTLPSDAMVAPPTLVPSSAVSVMPATVWPPRIFTPTDPVTPAYMLAAPPTPMLRILSFVSALTRAFFAAMLPPAIFAVLSVLS